MDPTDSDWQLVRQVVALGISPEAARLVAKCREHENAKLRETLADLYDGRSVVLPKTEKHAREMIVVAEACLKT